jgi:Methyltransferase domain
MVSAPGASPADELTRAPVPIGRGTVPFRHYLHEGNDVLARLKRILRPFRPVLQPIWSRIRPYVENGVVPTWRARRRRTRVYREDAPIRPVTMAEFDAVAEGKPYYRGRRQYVSAAAAQAEDLIDRHGLRSALELGPHAQPLIVGADVMVLKPSDPPSPDAEVVVHDATKVPWPIADQRYDLFVALQVFEHLGDKQPDAFHEVRRVARNAIISLPIDWVMDDPRNCHHMLSQERVLSWFAPVAPTRIVVGNGGQKRRMIYVFEDLRQAE